MQYDVQNLITNLFALSDIPCVQELLQALVCNGLGGNCSIGETTIKRLLIVVPTITNHLLTAHACLTKKSKRQNDK